MGGVVALGIATDVFGNVYATGGSSSDSVFFGSQLVTNEWATNGDIFIVKYDSAGNAIWARSAEGNCNAGASSINADASGNVYITGVFSGDSIVLGSITLYKTYSGGNTDFFIAKYDSAGNEIWARSAGGIIYSAAGQSVTTDNFGNVYVTGNFASDSISFGNITLKRGCLKSEAAFLFSSNMLKKNKLVNTNEFIASIYLHV